MALSRRLWKWFLGSSTKGTTPYRRPRFSHPNRSCPMRSIGQSYRLESDLGPSLTVAAFRNRILHSKQPI
ncbi:hypothetical protein AGR7A_Cc10001 [Agrobacterium deltaense NCPPB 1641]|uniref:Uncharacterized protein n=1 Tax=Agrobacterium deltaense NCPPB 1641 TaxID=1183425 RepID=A0A1S7TI61_9HYPH|nr:hypothetical protein AGR7A_Cc10001 [Agrobacterium deltaense NCPPB 1641]